MFGSIVTTIVPVFLVMGLGYVLRRRGLISDAFLTDANGLLYHVCLPCLLFVKIAAVPVDISFNGLLVAGSTGVLVLMFGASYGLARLLGYPDQVVGVVSQGAARGNMAYMGLAVIYYALGDAGLVSAGILLACLVPPVNLGSIMVLSMARSSCGGRGVVFWMREVFSNPLIQAAAAGIVVALLGVHLPVILDRGLGLVAEMTLPLALVAIGGSFAPQPVRFSWDVLLIVVFKNVLMPLATLLVLTWLKVGGVDLAAGVLIAAMPTAMVSYVMASELGGDTRVAGSAILVSTLASLVTVSGWLYVVRTWLGV
ncbi:AEC family transporter [Desulfoplanes formicivorans]|uniref:Membrane protein n=1 Tax=Desulfoplanes formicivorans TaxID=1592317 RepID=A0A194AJU0_9BACT|nr:AEC family transporter [Desulfoplanes formicivorans]GAU09583.1 membrane protein [Desulfoplanes formicivorans]